MGALSIEQKYDAQAAAALAEKLPEQQQHPLRRALQWSVGDAAATHWWVKSHQEVSVLTSRGDVRKMGNILADAQATEAVDRSAKGQRLAVPLPPSAKYGARPTAQGSADMEWCIHAPSKWKPPRALGTAPPRVPRDGNIACAATPRDVAPTSRGMPSLRKTRRGHNAVPMPVPQGQVAESAAGYESAMETTWGDDIAHHQRGPRSRTCIAEEGEGTHDWAAD